MEYIVFVFTGCGDGQVSVEYIMFVFTGCGDGRV